MKKLSLILFALLTTAVYSQDASLDSIALSEVTVTSKVVDVAKERETPIAFSTVTGAEIELKGGNLEFVETLRRTPGVYTNQDNGGYGDGQMYLRGFGFTNTAYVINGQPVNDMENGRVYWSNWAGLMDIASSVQLQRGLDLLLLLFLQRGVQFQLTQELLKQLLDQDLNLCWVIMVIKKQPHI